MLTGFQDGEYIHIPSSYFSEPFRSLRLMLRDEGRFSSVKLSYLKQAVWILLNTVNTVFLLTCRVICGRSEPERLNVNSANFANMYCSQVCICLSVWLFVYSFVLFYLFCSITITVTSAGWQVTLCDLIWHMISRSGVVISITNCYIRFTLLTLLYHAFGEIKIYINYDRAGPVLSCQLCAARAQVVLRLPRIVTLLELNAFCLSDLWECHRKSYTADSYCTTFCCGKYASISVT